jgi:hypothetical protein
VAIAIPLDQSRSLFSFHRNPSMWSRRQESNP